MQIPVSQLVDSNKGFFGFCIFFYTSSCALDLHYSTTDIQRQTVIISYYILIQDYKGNLFTPFRVKYNDELSIIRPGKCITRVIRPFGFLVDFKHLYSSCECCECFKGGRK